MRKGSFLHGGGIKFILSASRYSIGYGGMDATPGSDAVFQSFHVAVSFKLFRLIRRSARFEKTLGVLLEPGELRVVHGSRRERGEILDERVKNSAETTILFRPRGERNVCAFLNV